MNRPRSNTPPCPDCKGPTRKNGKRKGTTIHRYTCLNEGADPRCNRRFTDNTKDVTRKDRAEGSPETPTKSELSQDADVFLFTYAQNATAVHRGFWNALNALRDYRNADLNVIKGTYRNPTAIKSMLTADDLWWNDDVLPYLWDKREDICDDIQVLGDVRVRPTAQNPLMGFRTITGRKSGILGHTKLQLLTVPTPQGRYPKILTTTGAVTVKNYTDSKAGKLGEFHHSLGACAVDIVGGKFFMRQVIADRDGSFIDLEYEYRPNDVYHAEPALAVVLGDTHRKFMDPRVEHATFDRGGIVERLNPDYLVFHDLHDGYAENPHHRKDPFIKLAKAQANIAGIEQEVVDDVAWLRKTVGDRKAVIVPSNHDNFLRRYIVDTDWREDVHNAEFYLNTALTMVQSTRMTTAGSDTVDPFTHWVEKLKGPKCNVRCLHRDESFMLGQIELSMHGDQGPNGARGSRQNLRRIGVKSIIGHSHSPGIEEGCLQTGTSTPLKLEYNSGPSSWMNAHAVLYANGKRSLLFIIDGEWCFE